MKSIKKYFLSIITIFLIVSLSIGLALVMPSGQALSQAKAITNDFTQLTSSEQAEVNAEITADWGNPSSFTALGNGFSNSTLGTSGDKWLYLSSDIRSAMTGYNDRTSGHLRIVLNGYSISGSFYSTVMSTGKISFFDKIPNKSGTGYNYNPNSTRYYIYNSSSGVYSGYSSSRPSGTDVTDCPTYQNNTYITVTGSALASNAQDTSTNQIMHLNAGWNGAIMNFYGIAIVGRKQYDLYLLGANAGNLNLYQCTFVGNSSSAPGMVFANSSTTTLTIKGCKIYGNIMLGSVGLLPSNFPNATSSTIGYSDLYVSSGQILLSKSSIGVLQQRFYLKDADFGSQQITLNSSNTVSTTTFFTNIANIIGTIELLYANNMTYNASSPNLDFILQGNDRTSKPYRGNNTLNLNASARVKTVVVSGTAQINSGATVNQIVHTAPNGRLIDNRTSPATDVGSSSGSSNKVTINSGASCNILDLRAGSYVGIGSVTNGIDISDTSLVTTTLEYTTSSYTGMELTPTVKVRLNTGVDLVKDVNYSVVYANNKNVGTATVTITGINGSIGSRTLSFTIVETDISTLNCNLEYTTKVYTGEALVPLVTIPNGQGGSLTEGIDYTTEYADNTNAGLATVTVRGMENCVGEAKLYFTIAAKDIQTFAFTLPYTSIDYIGKAIEPEVHTQTDTGTALVKNVDYTITYADNTTIGTATVTVMGIGNYVGSRTLNFNITPATMDTVQVSLEYSATTYTGETVEPKVFVRTSAGVLLQEGVDYQVVYENNIDIGVATATVVGKANLVGEKTLTFQIVAVAATQPSAGTPKMAWIILGSSVGGILLLGMLIFLIVFLSYKKSKKFKYTAKSYTKQGDFVVCKKFNNSKK